MRLYHALVTLSRLNGPDYNSSRIRLANARASLSPGPDF